MAATTFGDVFSAVPHLGTTCNELFSCKCHGSGLKLLRLVSKQVRAATLGLMQGYSLTLDGVATTLVAEMSLFEGAKLSRLQVDVTPATHGGIPLGLNGWSAYVINLGCFLHGMGAAISSITQLELNTQHMHSSSIDDVAMMLYPLAKACPALRELSIVGDVGRTLLNSLGIHCCNLSSLRLSGTSGDGLQQLHLVLPHLTYCRLKSPSAMPPDANMLPAGCKTILSCSTLTHLDIGLYTLSSKMWRALPFSLRDLTCCLAKKSLSGLKTLPNLQHLTLQCHIVNQVNMCDAVAVLRVAPQLQCLYLRGEGEESMECSSCIIPHLRVPPGASHSGSRVKDLIFLHKCVVEGLLVLSILNDGGGFAGVMLSLQDDEIGTGEAGLGGFVASLPRFPAFTGLMLEEFKRGDVQTATKAITTAFPSLTMLVIDLFSSTEPLEVIELENQHLRPLGGFSILQQLCLEYVKVTPIQLAMLCPRLPSLKFLHLKQCADLTSEDGESLQGMLMDWGCDVTVSVDFGR